MIVTFERVKGSAMTLYSVGLQLLRNKNRRVTIDFDITKKYKHFDEKEFLKELEYQEKR